MYAHYLSSPPRSRENVDTVAPVCEAYPDYVSQSTFGANLLLKILSQRVLPVTSGWES